MHNLGQTVNFVCTNYIPSAFGSLRWFLPLLAPEAGASKIIQGTKKVREMPRTFFLFTVRFP